VPEASWCIVDRPMAEARAVDAHGHVHALRERAIVDETTGVTTVLPDGDPCPRVRWQLSFAADGSAVALRGGRMFVRADERAAWGATPACMDIPGENWARRTANHGWAVIARRGGGEPAMLMTDERSAQFGWYAVVAMDPSVASVVLEGDGSFVAIERGGHMIVVDRTTVVAGAVLAAQNDLFESLVRTPAGITASQDVGPDARVIVSSASIRQPFRRVQSSRPSGAHTRAVFAGPYGRMVAVTDRGVELARDPARGFVEVARWAAVVDGGDPSARASLGFLSEGSMVVVTAGAVVAPRCVVFAPAPDSRGDDAEGESGPGPSSATHRPPTR